MKIANILGIFTLVFGICSGQGDPKKTEELLDLFDKIAPGMKDQLLVLREFLKAFKVLNRKPQNNLYAYRKHQRIREASVQEKCIFFKHCSNGGGGISMFKSYVVNFV